MDPGTALGDRFVGAILVPGLLHGAPLKSVGGRPELHLRRPVQFLGGQRVAALERHLALRL